MTPIVLGVRIVAPIRDGAGEVALAVARVAAQLGLDVRPEVEWREEAVAPRLWIDGARLRYPAQLVVRARMAALGRLITPDERADDPGTAMTPAWLAAIVEGALIARPDALAGPAVTGALATALDVEPGELAWLVGQVLAAGVSLGSPARLGEALHALPAGRPAQRAEALLSRFHPREIVVELARADLVELARRDPHGDTAPFAGVHDRAHVELGLSAPIRLALADVPRGHHRIRINHLAELAQPLVPADRALVAAAPDRAPLYVPAWDDTAALGPATADATTALDYLALELSDAIARRGARLVERGNVDARLAALNKPALVALATAGPHLIELPRVLRALLAERVPVRDLARIVEQLVDYHEVEAPPPRAHIVLTRGLPVNEGLPAPADRLIEAVRRVLGGAIRTRAARDHQLAVLLLSPVVERALIGEPSAAWCDALVEAITARATAEVDAVMTTIEIRARLRALTADALPDLPVLSFQEIPIDTELIPVHTVELAATAPADPPRAAPVRPADDGFAIWLADAATRLPLDVLLDDAGAPPPPGDSLRRARAFAADPGRAPDALADQGWGVIVPIGPRGDALLAAIQALVDYRCNAQQAFFRLYRVAPHQTAADAGDWIREIFESDPAHRRPRYLLILGDLHEVSLELQLALAPFAGVGRLAFAELADYTRYADKAVAADQRARDRLRSLIYLADDTSRANAIARQQLVEPAAAQLAQLARDRRYALEPGPIASGGKAALLAGARDADFLLSVGHGAGSAMTYAQRTRLQGALLTAPGELLVGDDVAAAPFLPGGVWFLFACYGLGTPARSSYAAWIDDLHRTDRLRDRDRAAIEAGQLGPGEAPFIADLPRRALANPEGPLAVIGHVDLAWSYSFTAEAQSRFDRLFSTIQVILQAQLAGFAFEQLVRNCVIASDQLAQLYLQRAEHDRGLAPAVEPRLLARTWMLRQDLRGFILLGDPASRLRVG